MRHTAIGILLLLVALMAGGYWYLRAEEVDALDLIPASSLGLVVIHDFPPTAAQLAQTRIAQLLGLEGGDWGESGTLLEAALPELRRNVQAAWICLHGLREKAAGTFRIEFSVLVRPAWFAEERLTRWLEAGVRRRFGETGVRVREAGGARVIQGPVAGQVLWMRKVDDLLLVSNSETGMNAIDRTREGVLPAIGSRPGFLQAWQRVGGDAGIFIYLAGGGPADLIPELGYGVRFEEGKVFDSYWELPGKTEAEAPPAPDPVP